MRSLMHMKYLKHWWAGKHQMTLVFLKRGGTLIPQHALDTGLSDLLLCPLSWAHSFSSQSSMSASSLGRFHSHCAIFPDLLFMDLP